MKRSTSLSALLVGLTLTSLASAAPQAGSENQASPAAKPGAKPVLVAQNSDPQPSDGSGTQPSAPTTAPADGSGTGETGTAQPAISIGGSTAPATDTPQAAAEEQKAKPKPRPFAGTQIFLTTSMTTNTVFAGQTQYNDPTVEGNAWLLPRYTINDAFQLRGRLIASYEMTNSDETRYRNEPVLSDTTLQLYYKKIPEIATIKPMVGVSAALPTSKISQSRTMVFSPGAIVQLVKGFEHVLGGEVSIIAMGLYSHPIYTDRQAVVMDARPAGLIQCVGGAACGDLNSGRLNASDTFAYAAIVAGEWGKWAPAFYYLGSAQWVYHPTTVTESQVTPGGNNVPVIGVEDRASVRQAHYFSAWLDYNFNPWLTAEVGYWNSTPALNENGKYANPFWNRYADTRVYLGVNINIDNLMKQLEGGPAEAGIVRAQNNKKPMWTF